MSTGEGGVEDRAPVLRLWLAFFAFTATVAWLVQLVILPYVIPSWNGGQGLLVGGDWLQFHRIAVDLAEKIRGQGWSAWELRPEGQAPSGIAGAIYALTVPAPWTIVPLNAALQATSGIVLLSIVQVFMPNWRLAIWATLPFMLYPSSMTWYAQLHKDGYTIAGTLLFLYGWILMAQVNTWRSDWRHLAQALLCLVSGVILVWLMRPYVVQIMQGVAVLLALLTTVVLPVWKRRNRSGWASTAVSVLLVWVAVFAMTPFTRGGIEREAPPPTAGLPLPRATAGAAPPPSAGLPLPRATAGAAPQSVDSLPEPLWRPSELLPSFIENKFYALATVRDDFRTTYPDAASNVDIDVRFHDVSQVLRYLPRAAEIAFLAPFPSQWFERGSSNASTAMRRVSELEMIGVYLALLLLPYSIWRWRCRIEAWIVLVFCTVSIVTYGIATPNVGALYRMRYGHVMILAAIGILGGLVAVEKAGLRRWMIRFHRRVQRKPEAVIPPGGGIH